MGASRALTENPFFVLGCPITATGQEVERTAAKLLGLLELGAASAKRYVSPLGEHPRTADLVRAAAAELRDPEKRIVHEIWARVDSASLEGHDDVDQAVPAYPSAVAILGWQRRERTRR